MWFQEADCADRASPYDTSSSRSQVTIGQFKDQPAECVHAQSGVTREVLYRNTKCTGERATPDEFLEQKPLEFQARCLVVLIEEKSRKALLDMLIAAGRVLDQALRIEVNFTTTISTTPNFAVAAMSCGLGSILRENAARDAIGQELDIAITDLQKRLETKTAQADLYDKTVRGLSAYRPPNAPPPPGAAPAVLSFDERLAELRAEQLALSRELDAKRAELGGPCVPSPTNICGRSFAAGPNPWVAADGTKCAGHATYEALEGAFCAHWGSPVC